MTEYMNVHSNFGVAHIMMNVGWIDALKVVSKSIGGVLCIFTNFVLMSGVPRFWEVTVG